MFWKEINSHFHAGDQICYLSYMAMLVIWFFASNAHTYTLLEVSLILTLKGSGFWLYAIVNIIYFWRFKQFYKYLQIRPVVYWKWLRYIYIFLMVLQFVLFRYTYEVAINYNSIDEAYNICWLFLKSFNIHIVICDNNFASSNK